MIDLNFDLGEYTDEVSDDIITLINDILLEALEVHGINQDVEISLSFVDDEEIRDVNKRFRDKDSKTDVLSFPMLTEDEIEKIINNLANCNENPMGMLLLGDIIISVPTAKAQAKEYNHSFTREICFLTCHSILHLLGYDHDTAEKTEKMQMMEKNILGKIGVTREF
ncbi:MAG: rRNA maturation RNase YbeY [Proteocatella sp.]